MGKLIGVQFQKNGKLYYFDADGFEVKPGDYVIVDTVRGNDLGEVVLGPRESDKDAWKNPLKKTIRIATDQDIQHGMDNRQKEKEAFSICQKKILKQFFLFRRNVFYILVYNNWIRIILEFSQKSACCNDALLTDF